jgi:flagellar basal-body rod modification protein FlgD
MTTIAGASAAAAAATTSPATTAKTKTLGQSDFLSLLVAQLKNQDPLNPSDPTEFTAQLAQYSQLEQLFNLNNSMGNLTTAQSNSDRLSSLSLIGQDVVVEGSRFTLGDTASAQLGYKADGTATSIKLNIQNSAGKTVATLSGKDLTAGNHYLTWDGKDANGNTLPAGTYSIAVDAKNSAGASVNVASLIRATVTGVDLSGIEAQIVTGSGEYKISSIFGAYNSNQSALDSSKS